jgi:DNA gyrase inhibitor GyrI
MGISGENHIKEESIMNEMNIRIVKLPPMRVACVNGFGEEPENQAFGKMKAWAEVHNLLGKPCRLFGYNNPDPTPGSPNYGYDVWITVDESVKVNGEARLLNFPGGLYAVARLEVKSPGDEIPAAWQKMVKWMEAGKYHHGRHQWLEEHIGPLEKQGQLPFTLDLHLPISE